MRQGPLYLLLLFFIHPVLGALATVGAALLLALAWINEVMTRRPLKDAERAGNEAYVFTDNVLRHADVVRAMGAQMQSTLIVFHGAAEKGRSTGDTNPESIRALLQKAN